MFSAQPLRPLGRTAAGGVIALLLASLAAAQQQPEAFDPASKQAFLDSLDATQREYVIDFEGRAFLPTLAKAIPFDAGRARVYVQFQRALSDAERQRLYDAGVRFETTLTYHTYLALIERDDLGLLRQHPLIRGIEPVEPTDKLTSTLHSGEFMAHAVHPDGSVDVQVRFHADVSLRHALHVLDRWGVITPDRDRFSIGSVLEATVTHGQALVLAEEPTVAAIFEIPTPAIDDNLNAAALSNVDDVQAAPYNLDGTGVRAGLWESGNPPVNHPDLVGRVTVVQAASASDHAAHTSVTIMGDGAGNASALGMAPDAEELFSYTSAGNVAQEQVDSVNNDGIHVANHSWGRTAGWRGNTDTGNTQLFGLYDAEAAAWDAVVILTGLKIQKSAGNERSDCMPGTNPPSTANCDGTAGADGQQYDTITTMGNSKNIITVGAVDHVAGTPLAGFSSSGPTDDARIKPDVVADGVNLFSGWAQGNTLGGQIPGCNGLDYCTISGTSMSSPVTTGTVALLIEQYRQVYFAEPSPACIKAILVNTAMDLGRPGPDFLFGHGLVDALGAAQTIAVGPVRIVEGQVDTGEVDEYLLEVPGGTPVLDVTMCWIDPVGTANSAMPDAVHDLDLELVAPDNTLYFPWTHPLALGAAAFTDNAVNNQPNPVDTVEHATVTNPMQGIWRVRVKGFAVADTTQAYCVTANRSFNLPDQPNIEANANLYFQDGCIGDAPQRKTISVFNTGGAPLFVHDISVGALSDPDFQLLGNPSLPVIVQPGSHVDFTVLFTPMATGARAATFDIQSNDVDEPVVSVTALGFVGEASMRLTLEARGRFGIVPTGQLETRELQILNEGTCDLEVVSLVNTGGNALFDIGEISTVPGLPPFPLTLFPGEHVQVPITFGETLTAFGLQTTKFTLTTNDPTNPSIEFEVSARVPPPILDITGSTRFGVVCPGELVEKELQICNTGISDLVVTAVDFAADCPDFELINSPFPTSAAEDPTTVSHDFCLPLTIRYTPTGVGEHACVLKIETNDPVTPVLLVEVTGETPASVLDVTPELEFEPTVIQAVDNSCEHVRPFQIANNGTCPIEIADVRLLQAGNDYEFLNLPLLPTTLLPGEVLGDGNLAVRFAPEVVQRHILATVEVDYVTNDPNIGDIATVQSDLCGEGVLTGARLTVWLNGAPVPVVNKISLYKILNPETTNEVPFFLQSESLVALKTVDPWPPCDGFIFHIEYGGETNQIALPLGTYEIVVQHVVNGDSKTHAVRFVIDDLCDFFPRLTLDISQP